MMLVESYVLQGGFRTATNKQKWTCEIPANISQYDPDVTGNECMVFPLTWPSVPGQLPEIQDMYILFSSAGA
jgi:hypothetical protein